MAFNMLSPAEVERLDILQEECAEVIKAAAKIKRHGYESHDPTKKNHLGNRYDLAVEVGHVQWVANWIMELLDIDHEVVVKAFSQKGSEIQKYLHHQDAKS